MLPFVLTAGCGLVYASAVPVLFRMDVDKSDAVRAFHYRWIRELALNQCLSLRGRDRHVQSSCLIIPQSPRQLTPD